MKPKLHRTYWKIIVSIAVFLISLEGLATSAVAQVKPVHEFEVDERFLRPLFPRDGEIISQTLKKNVWPHNSEPFFRNETFELALGKGIRAKKDDRGSERSLTPSIDFKNGYIDVQAGWRLHKQVRVHNDFFDGVMRGRVFIEYVGGKSLIRSNFSIDWNQSVAAKVLLGVGDGIESILTGIAESKIEDYVNDEFTKVIDGAVDDILKKNGLPESMRNHVYVDVVRDGLRLRFYENSLVTKDVLTPRFDFRLEKTRGDGDFGGHGPRVNISSNIRLNQNKLYMKLSMKAEETKSDWTTGSGSQEIHLYDIPRDEIFIGVSGGNSYDLLRNTILSGHSPRTLSTTFLGTFTVVGDTSRDDDVPVYTGIEVSRRSHIRIITMKRR